MKSTVLKCLLVFLVSVGIAFLYFRFLSKPSYTSTVVVYPTSTLNPQFLLEAGLRFGDEKELNELLEVLNSNDVAIKVMNDMVKERKCVYCDDDTTLSIRALKAHTKIERSLNRSAAVSVVDRSPEFAAYIANAYARAAYDHFAEMVEERLQTQADVILKMYADKIIEVAILRDTLEKLEKLGEKKVSGLVVLESPRYRVYNTQFELELRKSGELKHQIEHLQGLIKKKMPRLFVVSTATPVSDIPILKTLFYAAMFGVFAVLTFVAFLYRTSFFDFSTNA